MREETRPGDRRYLGHHGVDYSLLWIIILFACPTNAHLRHALAASMTIGSASCATIIITPSALSVPTHSYRQPLSPPDQGVQYLPHPLPAASPRRTPLSASTSGTTPAARIAPIPQLCAAHGQQRAVGRASAVARGGLAIERGVAKHSYLGMIMHRVFLRAILL